MTNLPKMKPERAVVYWNQKCVDAVRSAAVAAWHCGNALAQVKEIKAHGEFGPWLAKIGISTSGAARYMTLAREYEISQLGKYGNVHQAILALAEGEKPDYQTTIGKPLEDALKFILEYLKENPEDRKLLSLWASNAPTMENDGTIDMSHLKPDEAVRNLLKAARACLSHIQAA